jgi:hypothetical protein
MVPLKFTNRFCSGKFTLHWHAILLILQHLFLTPDTVFVLSSFLANPFIPSTSLATHTGAPTP